MKTLDLFNSIAEKAKGVYEYGTKEYYKLYSMMLMNHIEDMHSHDRLSA